MIRGATAICCECAKRLDVVEPFTGGVGQMVRCPACGVQLVVRRMPESWEVRTMAEHKRQRTAPLPAVAPKSAFRLGGFIKRFFAGYADGGFVEPGDSSLRCDTEDRQ